jgi:hypothetical protein
VREERGEKSVSVGVVVVVDEEVMSGESLARAAAERGEINYEGISEYQYNSCERSRGSCPRRAPSSGTARVKVEAAMLVTHGSFPLQEHV